MRSPVVVAVANYFLPGTGYLLLGKRTVFAILLLLGCATQITQLIIDPLPFILTYGSSELSVALGLLAIFFLQLAFGYDAYVLAKDKNI